MGEEQEEIGMMQRVDRVMQVCDAIRQRHKNDFPLKDYPNLKNEVMGLLNEHFSRQERLDILVNQLVKKLHDDIEKLIWEQTDFTKDEREAAEILRHMALNWKTLEGWSASKNTTVYLIEEWVMIPGKRLRVLMGKEIDLSKAMKRICQFIEATAKEIDQEE